MKQITIICFFLVGQVVKLIILVIFLTDWNYNHLGSDCSGLGSELQGGVCAN